MKRFLKICFILLGSLILFILLMVTCTGSVIVGGAKLVAHAKLEAPAHQQTLATDNTGATLSSELTPVMPVVLKEVQLCISEGDAVSPAASDTTCINDQCTLDYEDEPVPDRIVIRRKYKGSCVRQTLTNAKQYVQTTGYKASLTFDKQLIAQLNLEGEDHTVTKTANSHFEGNGKMELNDTVRVWLNYKNSVDTDEFMLGTKRIVVKYIAAH